MARNGHALRRARFQTPSGVALLTDKGFEVWSGSGAPRLVVPLTQSEDSHTAYHDAGDAPAVRFSPDGAFATASTPHRFDVFSLTSGALVFSHEDKSSPRNSALLQGAAFDRSHLYGFLSTGDLIDVDLAAKAIVATRSFGELGHYSGNWFTDGASYTSNYSPILSPSGKYVDLFRGKKGHEILAVP